MKWKRSSEELKEKFLLSMKKFEEVEHKKMFGYPCCFFNGNMFTGLHEENWIVRLSEKDRQALQKLGGQPFEPLGRPMREYVMIPQDILETQE